MEWVRVRDRIQFSADKMQKVLLLQGTRGQLDLYCLRPGQAQKAHVHGDLDKIYLVLDGTGRVSIGAEERTLGPGEAALAPAGVEHGVANGGLDPLIVLVFIAPPISH